MNGARPMARGWAAIASWPLAWSLPVALGLASLASPLAFFQARNLDPTSAAMMVLVPLVPAVLVLSAHWLGGSIDRLRVLASTDPLTGAFHRGHFAGVLERALERARRDGRTTSVLCLDVDRLESINDGFGHLAGDRALLAVCGILASSIRSSDVIARMGGDEFALLLPDSSAAHATGIAQRILRGARASDPSTGTLAVSIGVVEVAPGARSRPAEVLAAADAALYRAKAAGGSRAAITCLGVAPAVRPGLWPESQTLFVEDLADGGAAS